MVHVSDVLIMKEIKEIIESVHLHRVKTQEKLWIKMEAVKNVKILLLLLRIEKNVWVNVLIGSKSQSRANVMIVQIMKEHKIKVRNVDQTFVMNSRSWIKLESAILVQIMKELQLIKKLANLIHALNYNTYWKLVHVLVVRSHMKKQHQMGNTVRTLIAIEKLRYSHKKGHVRIVQHI